MPVLLPVLRDYLPFLQVPYRAEINEMVIGIPKEIKIFENRVGMTPEGVFHLVQAGVLVLVEKEAGRGSGFSDHEYRKAGAKIISSRKELYRRSDLILKVKEPQASEYPFFRPGLAIFAFLHLAAEPGLLRELLKKKVTAIAFETVEAEGGLPLLAPMSEIAGSLASLIGANYLRKDLGGKGMLLNTIGKSKGESTTPGSVVVIGAGYVGSNAIRIAHGLGAQVKVYEKNQEKAECLRALYAERLDVIHDEQELSESLQSCDLLIGAVLIPGRRAPHIVTRKMVRQMEHGSVIVDVAVDQGGCVETIHPTTLKNPVYKKYNVLHYGVTNIPALVPRTATRALAAVTLPYVLKMGELGVECAWNRDENLRKGVNAHAGEIVHPALRRT